VRRVELRETVEVDRCVVLVVESWRLRIEMLLKAESNEADANEKGCEANGEVGVDPARSRSVRRQVWEQYKPSMICLSQAKQ